MPSARCLVLLSAALGARVHDAAIRNDPGAVRAALARGDFVDETDENGDTALIIAAALGSSEAVEALLEGGSNVSASNDGDTPLHFAAMKDQVEAANLLLSWGAPFDLRNGDLRTPLAMAAWYGKSTEVAELLLSKGASDFLVDRRGLSPLHLAVVRPALLVNLALACQNITPLVRNAPQLSMKADMVFVLCQNHVSQASLIDMPASRDGSTALHLAMRVGNQKAAKILLAQGASVELLDKDGATPLHRLVMQEDRGSASMVRELQVAGADVNVRSSNGESPLHLAAVSGNALAVKALLDIGADIDARTGSVASQPGSDEELVAGMTPLSLAVQYGKVAVVRVLLSRGASTSVASDAGASPLHLAAAVGGSPEVAQLLLESEAQIDARNDKGQTALHVAAAYGSENVLQILVARDAALGTGLLEAVSRKGHTPLHEAATYGTVGAARLLSQTGLALNATAKDGTTAFLRAVIEGHEDIVLQLIEAGSCVYARADGPVRTPALFRAQCCTLTLPSLLSLSFPTSRCLILQRWPSARACCARFFGTLFPARRRLNEASLPCLLADSPPFLGRWRR